MIVKIIRLLNLQKMINFNIEKPIIFFDLETTGLYPNSARIVQIALIKISPNGNILKKCRMLNPEIEIPADATNVHGITNEMVLKKPTFKQISKSLFELFVGCDTAGYNSRIYDLPILRNEFKRVGIEYNYLDNFDIDVFIFEKYIRKLEFGNKYERNNSKLIDLYEYYVGKKLEGAHDALIDVGATIDVLNGQINRINKLSAEKIYNFIPNNRSYDDGVNLIEKNGKYFWNFGKYSGELITLDRAYGKWFVNNKSFPLEERKIVGENLNLLYE